MARLYFHFCTCLWVQFLISELCPEGWLYTSAAVLLLCIHQWPRNNLVIPTSLWDKSYLQLFKYLENTISSSSAWCTTDLNTEFEKINWILFLLFQRKVWLVRMRSEEGNFKLESWGLVSALCSWNYINWKYLCVLEMHLKVPRVVFTEMEFWQHYLCQGFISLRRWMMCF